MLVQNNDVETLYYGYKDNQRSLIAHTDQDGKNHCLPYDCF